MKSTEELENLGWLIRPVAKEFFLNSPSLLEQYQTYDAYITAIYGSVKDNWSNSGGSASSQTLAEQETQLRQKAMSRDREKLDSAIKQTDDLSEDWFGSLEASADELPAVNAITSDYSQAKTKKLKLKKRKEPNFIKKDPIICPYCLSLLKTNEVKVLECTGDKLRVWELEFLKFNKLSPEQRGKYLIGISNRDMFLDLQEKWSFVDDKGQRPNFTCGYSNRIFNPISRYRLSVPDPMLVRAIERSLGRELTEEEKHNESEIWQYQGAYKDKYKKGANKVRIPQVVFPEGFL